MLTGDENDLLTRVGPGTPMGELFRRFWLPALLPSELPRPDCPPVRLPLLGERLVAFRDTEGRVGVLDEFCAHRGVSLYFGRNEECGLRCVYHGWKYDVRGQCVDMPAEPAGSRFADKIRLRSYPSREWGGLIWVYLGSPERVPELPQFEWAEVPDDHRRVSKWIQETNYLSGLEGEVDSAHFSYLHRWFDPGALPYPLQRRGLSWKDPAPRLTVKETEYGFVYGSRRDAGDGRYYWRANQWLLPTYTMTASPEPLLGGRAWIPIDDERTWTFAYSYHPDRPLTAAELDQIESGFFFPPKLIPNTFRPAANRDNDYQLDREAQRTRNFTGIWGVNNEDRAVQESVGPRMDRAREHLGASDRAIIATRRILLRAVRGLQAGVEPQTASRGELYAVRPLDALDAEPEFDRLVEAHRERVFLKGGPRP
jgi:phenylpropionate dioxygenase-like ring-hydroxylating dioxygenase large terminal subunit